MPAPDAEIVRCATFEMPKSVSRSRPSGNSSKLSGFTSQWMTCCSWANATARSSCSPKSSAVSQRQPPRQPLFQRLLAERQRDHEVAVDEVGRLESEDIRMIELRRQPHFARKVVERLLGHQPLVRNLQRNVHAFERIEARNTVAYGPLESRAVSLYLPIFWPGLKHEDDL